MANIKLDLDKIFQLVMECRQSGLSDRQWCIEHDIHPSTFYSWVKKLRDYACYDVPKNTFYSSTHATTRIIKQDVVKIDMIPDEVTSSYSSSPAHNNTPVIIQYQQANILIHDNFNPDTLKNVLTILKETLC